jgi:hypothetical protein
MIYFEGNVVFLNNLFPYWFIFEKIGYLEIHDRQKLQLFTVFYFKCKKYFDAV